MLEIEPVDRLSRTNTSSPRARSASDRCDPTNPAPPVINTRITLFSTFYPLPHEGEDGIYGALSRTPIRADRVLREEGLTHDRKLLSESFIIQDSAYFSRDLIARRASHDARLDERRKIVGQPDDER